MTGSLLLKPRRPGAEGVVQRITPHSAGWHHVGFEAIDLLAGQTLSRTDDVNELCLVLVAGTARIIAGDSLPAGRSSAITGRSSAATGAGRVAPGFCPVFLAASAIIVARAADIGTDALAFPLPGFCPLDACLPAF